MKIIINRLQELRTEEKAKERTIKNVLDAEKAYYRGLYKNYSRSEIEALDRACKEMKNKARLSEVSYRNSMVSILNQCLHIFMVELSATSDMQKNFAEKILDLLSTFDDSPRTFSTLGFNFDVENDDHIFPDNNDTVGDGLNNKLSRSTNKSDFDKSLTPANNGKNNKLSRYSRLASFMSEKLSTKRPNETFSPKNSTLHKINEDEVNDFNDNDSNKENEYLGNQRLLQQNHSSTVLIHNPVDKPNSKQLFEERYDLIEADIFQPGTLFSQPFATY